MLASATCTSSVSVPLDSIHICIMDADICIMDTDICIHDADICIINTDICFHSGFRDLFVQCSVAVHLMILMINKNCAVLFIYEREPN